MSDELFGNMLCVDLSIGRWTAERKDGAVTRATAESYKALGRAGKYVKYLIDPNELSKIASLASQIRSLHYSMTLPWADGGQRVITAEAFFQQYRPTMDKMQDEFNKHVEEFLDRYTSIVSNQATRLGDMFDLTDYPTRMQLERKFYIDIVLSPVATADDFRVDAVKYNVDELKERWEEVAKERVESAIYTLYDKLIDSLGALSEIDKKKRLYDSAVIKPLETARLIKSLDNWNTEASRLADRVISSFTEDDINQCRDQESLRVGIAATARKLIDDIREAKDTHDMHEQLNPSDEYEDVMKKMGSVYGTDQ